MQAEGNFGPVPESVACETGGPDNYVRITRLAGDPGAEVGVQAVEHMLTGSPCLHVVDVLDESIPATGRDLWAR